MSTEKLVKWSKESKEFFEKAEDNSIVLDIFISYSCASQTGEGFEELVNTINSEKIKRKVKKVVITDTSYLYRHMIPKFSIYSDSKMPTEWFLINKDSINKLKCNYEVKSWANEIKTDAFSKWFKQIMIDYNGYENGNSSGGGANLEILLLQKQLWHLIKGRKILKIVWILCLRNVHMPVPHSLRP